MTKLSEKQKPAFDAFSVEEREGQKPFYRPTGCAWSTKSGEGYILVLPVIPLSGRILLLPYKERPPKEASDTE